jgi:undecaprenyl-diphosphatase
LGPIEAVVLGVVQGLTEFLPISSSGHLVLFQTLLGLREPALLFDIFLHMGTLLAVCAVFFNDIRSILLSLLRLPALWASAGGLRRLYAQNADVRMAALIVTGTLPTVVLGLAFNEIAERLFSSVGIVGCTLLITGCLLWVTRRTPPQGRPLSLMTVRDALLIGFFQGLAITPGISRSGATISIALLIGVQRELAGRYSFLLSLPAICGALVLGLDSSAFQNSVPTGMILIGTAAAAVVGYLALLALLRVVKGGHLYRFAPYCWAVGLTALAFSLV